jgi:hypothetical protein
MLVEKKYPPDPAPLIEMQGSEKPSKQLAAAGRYLVFVMEIKPANLLKLVK